MKTAEEWVELLSMGMDEASPSKRHKCTVTDWRLCRECLLEVDGEWFYQLAGKRCRWMFDNKPKEE